jgi:hypothetical protein
MASDRLIFRSGGEQGLPAMSYKPVRMGSGSLDFFVTFFIKEKSKKLKRKEKIQTYMKNLAPLAGL